MASKAIALQPIVFFAHDLFGKPVLTFPDHAREHPPGIQR
jgi:hypothetical protein